MELSGEKPFIARPRSREQDFGLDPVGGSILRQRRDEERPPAKAIERPATRSVDFHDAGCFHDRRFLLAFGKVLGAFAINVHARELLTVVVVHRNLPVAMLTPAVPVEPAGFP